MKTLSKPLKRFWVTRIFLPLYCKAAESVVKELSPHIQEGDEVLDLGCGTGIIAEKISKQLKVHVLGIDVRDVRVFDIPFVLYDGNRLPFPDKSFDVVLISYVLHHVANNEALLGEAKRVCRKKIIIQEDTPRNALHWLSCRFHGLAFNRLFRLPPLGHFRSHSEWTALFNRLQLRLLVAEEPRLWNPIHPTSRSRFVVLP